MVGALGSLVSHIPRPSVFLDYEPWIRFMVSVDDELERNCEGMRRMDRSRRVVTRSHQYSYERYIELSNDQREVFKATRLGLVLPTI